MIPILINNIKYIVNKNTMYQENITIKKIIYPKMSDYNNISLTIPNINNNIINVYIDMWYWHRNMLEYLSYENLMNLLLVLNMYPLNNFKLEKLEYYVYKKYKRNKIHENFLKHICQTYELRYLTSKFYNYFD